jgi:glycosyltransferase involved in cell wall biosynthesis
MIPKFTILLPIVRPPDFLPAAIETVIAQTVAEFELFVVLDGAPPESIDCANEFARRDSRVKVFTFSKGARVGEANWHAALESASGRYVAHLEDDDLWFPNHLEELEKLLLTADFGNTLHTWVRGDGYIEALNCDLSLPEFRERMLAQRDNRFGLTVCGYRLEAYRRLPEGWAPSPDGFWPDLHMWRKFIRMRDFTFDTRMTITALGLPGFDRGHTSSEERTRESRAWLKRVLDNEKRAEIVQSAWRSIVHSGVRIELGIDPQRVQIATDGDVQAELTRAIISRDELRAALDHANTSRDTLQAEVDRLVHSKSWQLTKPLRNAATAAVRLRQLLSEKPTKPIQSLAQDKDQSRGGS